MRPVTWVFLGGMFAATAVALGAIGAHVLQARLTPQQMATFHTAVQYQMYHALGLVLIGAISLHDRSRWFDASGWLMLVGILLFCGFLYAWVATGNRLFVHPVPFGGVAFLTAWLTLGMGAVRRDTRQTS